VQFTNLIILFHSNFRINSVENWHYLCKLVSKIEKHEKSSI